MKIKNILSPSFLLEKQKNRNHSKMKKGIAFLCILLCLSMLASCDAAGGEVTTKQEEGTNSSAEA